MKPNRDTFNHEHRYKILLSKEKDEQKDEKEEEIEDITSYHVFGLPMMSQRHHQTVVTSLSLACLNGKVVNKFLYIIMLHA